MYKCDGLVIEQAFDKPRHQDSKKMLKRLKKKVPIIWLVRDPIEIIKSYANLIILRNFKEANDMSGLIKYLLDDTSYTIDFDNIYSQVSHLKSKLFIFDTKDISGETNIKRTMDFVAKELELGDFMPDNHGIHGNEISRIFPIKLAINLQHYSHTNMPTEAYVLIAPYGRLKRLEHEDDHDFFFRLQNKDLSSCVFVKRKIFLDDTIVLEELQNYPLHVACVGKNRKILYEEITKNPKIFQDIITRVKNHYQMMMPIINHAKNYTISADFLIDFILKDPELAKTLYEKITYQAKTIKELAPHIYDLWKYTHQFIRLYEDKYGK
ncbi:DUF2972 domain-containing protein [Helicobacter sp. 11S02596-1]|uniref:DUF2972 domain-containing protein n=1 Tax=Helicobacter sp. 11S02596-1 TaxID=1476194 RepID=UPI000BA6F5E7|nr:DUF2972 domain-containing protein [Helicobacter sp. 11S02596-1]PAF44718.1 hypothetical protein BJI48_01635 [Helicobacter sp. 11S02596-1]